VKTSNKFFILFAFLRRRKSLLFSIYYIFALFANSGFIPVSVPFSAIAVDPCSNQAWVFEKISPAKQARDSPRFFFALTLKLFQIAMPDQCYISPKQDILFLYPSGSLIAFAILSF
jgi:hypothetical protein